MDNSQINTFVRRRSLVKDWLFAKGMACGTPIYNAKLHQRKTALFDQVRKDPKIKCLLEIGVGTGANFAYYAKPGLKVIGVEPNTYMFKAAYEEAAKAGIPRDNLTLVQGMAELLPVETHSQDAVVLTLTLCSVLQPETVLAEIQRVLKPGGVFVFMEHVAANKGTWLRSVQNAWNPVHRLLFDQCHCNRETWATLESAGFDKLQLERFDAPMPAIVKPHIMGVATTAPARSDAAEPAGSGQSV